MDIARISSITPIAAGAPAAPTGGTTAVGGDIGRAFTDVLDKLSKTEQSTNNLVARAAAGENVDIQDVMIATQTESLAFQLAIQVRNKLVEGYQEIFRMQV